MLHMYNAHIMSVEIYFTTLVHFLDSSILDKFLQFSRNLIDLNLFVLVVLDTVLLLYSLILRYLVYLCYSYL